MFATEQGLLEGVNELVACRQLLEPHMDAADADLAELALAVPLAQVRSHLLGIPACMWRAESMPMS
jgi:hypothetical protein